MEAGQDASTAPPAIGDGSVASDESDGSGGSGSVSGGDIDLEMGGGGGGGASAAVAVGAAASVRRPRAKPTVTSRPGFDTGLLSRAAQSRETMNPWHRAQEMVSLNGKKIDLGFANERRRGVNEAAAGVAAVDDYVTEAAVAGDVAIVVLGDRRISVNVRHL